MRQFYYYQVYPVGYALLHADEQVKVVEGFKHLLNQLRAGMEVYCRREEKTIEWEDLKLPAVIYSFYVKSEERLDELLDSAGILYQPLANPPPSLITSPVVKPRYVFSGGRVYRVLYAYRLPSTLTEGFLQDILPLVDELRMQVKPVERRLAVKLLHAKRRLLRAIVSGLQAEGRPVDIELSSELSAVEELLEAVSRRETNLFTLRLTLLVSGENRGEAYERADTVKRELEALGFEVDSPAFAQMHLYEFKAGRPVYTDTITLGAFYPFISNTLMETDGVFLGVSRLDKSPVFLDLYVHTNYNLVALGIPGAGKSATGKTLVYRYYKRLQGDLDYYIIDPEGEYKLIAEKTGGVVVDVKPGSPLGLDPLKLLGKSDAVDVVSTLAGVPGDLYGELASLVARYDSIWSVYENASSQLKKYLSGLLEGPDSFIFQGEPRELGRRVVVVLKGVESERVKNIISLMVFAGFWRSIENAPVSRRKMVVVDEAWLLLKNPSASAWMEAVSRRGRKRNVAFIFLTQQPQDVLRNPVGSVIVRNSACKLILMQDVNAIDVVAGEFKLSDAEKQEVLRAQPGEGLLITENARLSLRITLSRSEYSLITTKPGEIHEAPLQA